MLIFRKNVCNNSKKVYNGNVYNSRIDEVRLKSVRNARLRSMRMSYKISNTCINCDACTGECPVSAIFEQDERHFIEADKCVSCGSCAGVCPVFGFCVG